jgi:hypothetical protein
MCSFRGIAIAITAIAGVQLATLGAASATPNSSAVDSSSLSPLSWSDVLSLHTESSHSVSGTLYDYEPPDDVNGPNSSQGSGTR